MTTALLLLIFFSTNESYDMLSSSTFEFLSGSMIGRTHFVIGDMAQIIFNLYVDENFYFEAGLLSRHYFLGYPPFRLVVHLAILSRYGFIY